MHRFLLRLFLPVLIFTIQLYAQDFNDIDAVSSASGKYRITGGKAYADNAELDYSWRYTNGTMAIKWGTTSSMTDGDQSIKVFPPSGTVALSSLQPNTLYYFKLHGTYAGYTYSNLGSGTFTTASDGAITFALNVVSGSGDGDYEEGVIVDISADSPQTGKEFDKWTGDVSTVSDVNSASTTMTMPGSDATITATYKDLIITYSLTVNSGSGDGDYEEGDVVDISADNPASGKEFDKWTGDVSNVADINSADTKITIPSSDVTVTATYRDISVETFALVVNSGSGDGNYVAGEEVTITADSPASGKEFDKWTGDVSNVADVNSASTKITMPSSDITVTATYKDIIGETFTLTVNSGTGDGDYAAGQEVTITADSPASGKVFDKWTGDVDGVADVSKASTKITMPSGDATVTATYKDEVIIPDGDNYLKVTAWESEIDAFGSAVDIDTSDMKNSGMAIKFDLKATVDTNYTWAKVAGYNDGNFSNVAEVKISYTSDKDFNVVLEQEGLSELGTSYEYKIPAASDSEITIAISDFAQPSWVSSEPDLQKDLDMAKVTGISFAAITEGAVTNVEIRSIFLNGYEDTPIGEAYGIEKDGSKGLVEVRSINKNNLKLSVNKSGSYKISVYSLSGQLLFSEVRNLTSGGTTKANIIPFNSTSISSGVRVVNIAGKGWKSSTISAIK